MGTGIHGGFGNTLGTTYGYSGTNEETYADRGIDIPNHLKTALTQLQKKGDYFSAEPNSYSMKDVSILSKESGVEFAKVTIDGKSYIIRGDKVGTTIPKPLLQKMKSNSGTLEFHSHPHNDDCIPSSADRALMKTLRLSTGQTSSTIVTPNGRTSIFNEHGIISTGTVPNTIDDNLKQIYLEMFGGK